MILRNRNKQVAMMGRLYSETRDTRLWLGEEDEGAVKAFDLISCFECIEPSVTDPTMLVIMHDLDVDDIRANFFDAFPQVVGKIPPNSDPRWRDLFKLLDRPWCSRLWIFQETVWSQKGRYGSIQCGPMTCNFLHLYLAICLLFVDWKVSSLPPGLEMVYRLMLSYSFGKQTNISLYQQWSGKLEDFFARGMLVVGSMAFLGYRIRKGK